MQITLYGTGSCIPSPKRDNKPMHSYTGWCIEIGEDSLLFDIGSGLIHKMLEDGKDVIKNPTHLFISHFHPDHSADISALMQTRGVAREWGKGVKSLQVAGPEGLNKFFEEVLDISKWVNFKEGLDVKSLFNLNEVANGKVFEEKEWKVTCSPIEHFNGNCYRLDVGEKSIVYSGDMIYDERICEIGKDADIAILECSVPDREFLKGPHLCPEDIGRLAKLGGFKKVVLTHMYPVCEGREEEMITTIKSIADCEVVVGYDFLKIEI